VDELTAIKQTIEVQDAGRTCPYCRFALKAGSSGAVCVACRAAHHADCWDDNMGCTIAGCVNAPQPTAARTVVAQTGPAQTSKEREPRLRAGTPTPVPAPPPTSPRSTPGRAIAFALTGLALAVVAVAAVLLLKKNISPNADPPDHNRPTTTDDDHHDRVGASHQQSTAGIDGDAGQRSCPRFLCRARL
jgi:hypothetical protein